MSFHFSIFLSTCPRCALLLSSLLSSNLYLARYRSLSQTNGECAFFFLYHCSNDYDGDCPYKDCPEVTLSLVSLVGCSNPLQVGCLISGACGDLRVIDYDGNVEYTPNGSGCPTPDVFSYCMTDNQGGSACAEFRFEVNNAPVAENDVYTIPTGGLVDGDVSISHQLFNNDYDPDWEENPRDDPDFDDQYSTIKVISVDGQPIDNSGTFAMGDGTLLVERVST